MTTGLRRRCLRSSGGLELSLLGLNERAHLSLQTEPSQWQGVGKMILQESKTTVMWSEKVIQMDTAFLPL